MLYKTIRFLKIDVLVERPAKRKNPVHFEGGGYFSIKINTGILPVKQKFKVFICYIVYEISVSCPYRIEFIGKE